VEVGNLANFPLLETEIQQAEDGLPQELRDQIIEHLDGLCETVQDNFGDVEELKLLDPFRIDVSTTGDDEPFIADELIDAQNSSDKKTLFIDIPAGKFWCCCRAQFPNLAKKEFEVLVPFVTTYQREQSFSMMLV